MDSKLINSACIIIIVLLVCFTNNKISFGQQNDPQKNENIEDRHIKCLQQLAKTAINMLIATRSVIAKNQELINRDPATGNYNVKGFVPAVVGSQVANNFSLMTGHKLKQTSLNIRNPSNAPDQWEKKVLKFMDTPEYPKGKGFGETIKTNGNKIYRYMKPIYVEVACLQCSWR
ncbi:MAG: Tll0287-like domain-containing protein [Planctomycetota bacterium]|jgi:methyl-accepting chemotaxis protein